MNRKLLIRELPRRDIGLAVNIPARRIDKLPLQRRHHRPRRGVNFLNLIKGKDMGDGF
jgi:hypothetical protein